MTGALVATRTFHRDRFTWLAYLLLAFYGYFLNILGPITPFLKEELELSYTVSSLHFTAFAAGILLIGLSGHALIRRVGRWHALWIGAFGISISAVVLLAGQSPVITIGASFCMGLVGSLILVIVPAALADQHREHRAVALSEANVIASLVSTAAPLLVGWSAHLPGGWRLALGMAALTPILLRLGFGRAMPPQPASSQEYPSAVGQPLPVLYWVYWVAIVLAVSVEFCMIFWSADYLENSLGLLKVDAAQAVSLFLAAMIVGRLVGSRLVHRFPPHRVIMVSILVAGTGFLVFWMTGNAILGLGGLFATGLGVANLYPLILSLAIGTASNNAVQASARATLASGTAILALPLVLGRLADLVGIRPAYGVVTILLIGVFLIVVITGRNAPVRV
ncbi:MAG: MFS transporter [Chloroflexi bacterium]|nr:MFS transporter [Chloroflexota bacterium]MBU1746397.1 MFS transporter [Chloroflexota bacterium]